MSDDPIEILSSIVDEAKGLRQQIEFLNLHLKNIAIRMAVNQMRHGEADYKNCPDSDWDALLVWADQGRLQVASGADVFLDLKLLTKELFDKEKPPPVSV